MVMRFVFAFSTLIAGFHALRLDDGALGRMQDYQEEVSNIMRRKQADEPSGQVVQTNLMIVGNLNAGKSSLCQWLLGRTDICTVYDSEGVHTSEIEIAAGYWFNDQSLGELRVMDTIGFLTAGEDGSNWATLLAKVKADMPDLDGIIYAQAHSGEASSFHDQVMNMIRNSFGSELWENLIFVGKPDNKWEVTEFDGGYTDTKFADLASTWKTTFTDVEFLESRNDWSLPENAQVKTVLEAQIQSIPAWCVWLEIIEPIFTGDPPNMVFPGYLMMPANDPQWPVDNEKRKLETRIHYLVELRDWVMNTRSARGEAWNINHIVPRFGPSIVTGSQRFECKWPNPCSATITGTFLSNADRLQLFPMDHTCGNSFAGWPGLLPVEYPEVRPIPEDESDANAPQLSRNYELGDTVNLGKDVTEFRACYCEYGSCTTSERFFQEAGIFSTVATQCQVPCPEESVRASISPCGPAVTTLALDTLQYSCEHGYAMNGDASLTSFQRSCSSAGELGDEHLVCSIVKCPETPALPANAEQITADNGQEHTWKDPFRFICLGDYTMDGNPNGQKSIQLQCGADGAWSFLEGASYGVTWTEFMAGGGCRRWKATEFSACQASCGTGVRTRSVACEPEGASCNTEFMPAAEEACTGHLDCPDCGHAPDLADNHAKFAYSDGGDPPLIETGANTVYYECDYLNDYTLTGGEWYTGMTVGFEVSCEVNAAEERAELTWQTSAGTAMTHDYVNSSDICRRWEITGWGACSVTCGSGYTFRNIVCSSGKDNCPSEDKPSGFVLSRRCYVSEDCDEDEDRDPTGDDGNGWFSWVSDQKWLLGGGAAAAVVGVGAAAVSNTRNEEQEH